MRAPKTRTLDHFLFSPRLRNASGAIIHRDDVSVVWFIFFCFGRNAAIWFYRDYRSQRDCFTHSDGNCTDGRIFVCSQTGALRVIKNGALLATPFVTLSVDSVGERGLLGVAFDPYFTLTHYIYLYYTVPGTPAHNRVVRFTANGDVVLAGSRVILLELNSLSTATNHNGGALHFGPDGNLYIAVGDNAEGSNSQNLSNLLGKILRLNSDGTIPSDNPFVQSTTARHEIWALGLRNPFTFAFRGTTNFIYINDVGQSTWEEIDLGQAGANYGWPATEGPTTNPAYQSPIYYYGHSDGYAITGGPFYSPSTPNLPPSYDR